MSINFSFDSLSKQQILDSKYIALSIDRKEIETLNFDRLIVVFNTLKELKTKAYRKLILTFDGYEDDLEEVYEIVNIREYIFKLFTKYPYLFYYISTFDLNMKILLACLGDVFKKVEIGEDSAKNIEDILYTDKAIAPVQFKYTLPQNILEKIIPATLKYCVEVGETEQHTNQLIAEITNPSLGQQSNIDMFEFLREKKGSLIDIFSQVSKDLWNAWVKQFPAKILIGERQIHSFVVDNQNQLKENIDRTQIIKQVVINHKYTNLFVCKNDSLKCNECGNNIVLILKKEMEPVNEIQNFLPEISEYIKKELTPFSEEYRKNSPIPIDNNIDKRFCLKCRTISKI